MLSFDAVSFSYTAEQSLLKEISFNINRGQWTAVIGANGSGKSTIARLMNGLLLPVSGRVNVDGMDTLIPAQIPSIRRKISFVFQNPDNQLVATTVEDDIAFGPENLALPPAEIAERVERALQITGLTPLRYLPVYELSGGEKQRVAIAGALAMSSDYLVLDEPTSMLDPSLRAQVLSTLKTLHADLGMGIIYITNVMEEVLLAERVLILSEGRIVKDSTPAEIFSDSVLLSSLGLDIPEINRLTDKLHRVGILSAEEKKNIRSIDELAGVLCG